MGEARHNWTPDHDGRLEAAVTALAASDLRGVRIWDAVCGRLAPEICVTPDAAKSRYGKLLGLRREAAERGRRERAEAALAELELQREATRQAEGRSALRAVQTEEEALASWRRQVGECPCGTELPVAGEGGVVCRHCGRAWRWEKVAGGEGQATAWGWTVDGATHAQASTEEAWERAAQLLAKHEADECGEAGVVERGLAGTLGEALAVVRAVNLGQVEVLAMLADITQRLDRIEQAWK